MLMAGQRERKDKAMGDLDGFQAMLPYQRADMKLDLTSRAL